MNCSYSRRGQPPIVPRTRHYLKCAEAALLSVARAQLSSPKNKVPLMHLTQRCYRFLAQTEISSSRLLRVSIPSVATTSR